MKVKFFGNGVVFDAERQKVLCYFVNGEYITEDKREIDILSKYYKSEELEKQEVKKVKQKSKKKEG